MTLLNAWIRGDSLHMMTDGLDYDGAGRPVGRAQKIFTFGQGRFAITSRGVSAFVPALALALYNRAASYDELLTMIGPLVREMMERATEMNPLLQNQHIELMVGGWSDAKAAPDMAFVTDTGPFPWQALEAGDSICAPGDAEQLARFRQQGIDPVAPDFDPEVDGLRFAQAQRDLAIDLARGSRTAPLIGGSLEIVSITRDEIRSRILHRWPQVEAYQ